MTADLRLTAAREFLAGARKRRVAELPPSVLMREDAELRRLLGQVLDYVAEHEAGEQAHDVTGLTPPGGARISPADLPTVLGALSHAAWWCEQAEGRDAEVAAYRSLSRSLGDDR